MELITIGTYAVPWQAELAKARLEENGIAGFLQDSHTNSLNSMLGGSIAIRLQVAEADVERASEILASPVDEDALMEAFEQDMAQREIFDVGEGDPEDEP